MAGAHSILHLSDLEKNGNWMLARKSLALRSFGVNAVEIPPGESIPEHDERGRDQEELFVVWEGDAVFVIDGHDHAAPKGTFLRIDPEPQRTVRNDSDSPATVLIISAPTSSGFEPMDWA